MPGPSGERNGNFKHGMRQTRQYRTWAHMVWRCTNPNCKDAKYYRDRGITFPEKWKTFLGFWEDMGNTYIDGYTIDRKDNNLGYSKNNCQWIPLEENIAKDKRKSIEQYDTEGNLLKIYVSAREASRQTGINTSQISRVARGQMAQTHGFTWKYTNA